MKFVKEIYIHNRVTFEENEKDTLCSAYKIISTVRNNNIRGCGAEDSYLNQICDTTLKGISELLDNYSNEYPNKILENT